MELANEPFAVSLSSRVQCSDDLRRLEEAGVDRLVVSPWRRTSEALDGLRRLAEIALA